MNPKSAKALIWIAILLIVAAPVVMSPSGSFAALILAGTCAAVAIASTSKRVRVIALLLLIATAILAVRFYPAFQRDQAAYSNRVHSHVH